MNFEDNEDNVRENNWGCLFIIILLLLGGTLYYMVDDAASRNEIVCRNRAKEYEMDSYRTTPVQCVLIKNGYDISLIDYLNYLEVKGKLEKK